MLGLVTDMFVALAKGSRGPRRDRKGALIMKIKLLSAAAAIALAVTGGAIAAGEPMVGGAAMSPTETSYKTLSTRRTTPP